MKDLAQDVAEDVLGAAKDGGVKVLIFPIATCKLRTNTKYKRAPALALR